MGRPVEPSTRDRPHSGWRSVTVTEFPTIRSAGQIEAPDRTCRSVKVTLERVCAAVSVAPTTHPPARYGTTTCRPSGATSAPVISSGFVVVASAPAAVPAWSRLATARMPRAAATTAAAAAPSPATEARNRRPALAAIWYRRLPYPSPIGVLPVTAAANCAHLGPSTQQGPPPVA